jgi:hypothetical protein
VAGVVVICVALIAWLLSTGAEPEATADTTDPSGDVKVATGPQPPRDLDTADVEEVDARSESGVLTLIATMGQQLVRPVPGQSATWRWEIYEEGEMTWIVSANVDFGPNASILSTKSDYSAATNDKSLPGKVSVAGDTILIRLRTAEIEGFPATFEVALKTSLDGIRTEARSALAADRAPDEGYLRVGG